MPARKGRKPPAKKSPSKKSPAKKTPPKQTLAKAPKKAASSKSDAKAAVPKKSVACKRGRTERSDLEDSDVSDNEPKKQKGQRVSSQDTSDEELLQPGNKPSSNIDKLECYTSRNPETSCPVDEVKELIDIRDSNMALDNSGEVHDGELGDDPGVIVDCIEEEMCK